MPIEAGEALIGAGAMAGGIALLGASWRRRRSFNLHFQLGGWLFIIAGFVLFARIWGGEVGTFYGLLLFTLAGYLAVVAGLELRQAQGRAPREAALEPEERPRKWGRGIAKSLLAIVLAGIASIGVGVALALTLPMPAYDRIMIGGILVPVLWGAGMAWTLSDARLLRATIVLVSVSVVSYGIAFLPKVLA